MLHDSTFEYLKPTNDQIEKMSKLRAHRSNAMRVNVAVTRQPDGTPRT